VGVITTSETLRTGGNYSFIDKKQGKKLEGLGL
jgi:hypothetical protein